MIQQKNNFMANTREVPQSEERGRQDINSKVNQLTSRIHRVGYKELFIAARQALPVLSLTNARAM